MAEVLIMTITEIFRTFGPEYLSLYAEEHHSHEEKHYRESKETMLLSSKRDNRPKNSRTRINANEVKRDNLPRKKRFLLMPMHPTVSTFFCFCMSL
jgi:hypothetical protein